MRQGEVSRRNAFNLWRENTILKTGLARSQALVKQFKEETAMEKKVGEELEDEIAQVEFDTKMNEKEFKREKVWYETKLKKITLDSNTSKSRGKAIELCMSVLMERHKQRLQLRCFNRMYEHKMLEQIKESY